MRLKSGKVLSTLSFLCLGIGSGLLPSLSGISAQQQQLRFPAGLQDVSWEKQLETGLIALEANCDVNSVPFNREKVVIILIITDIKPRPASVPGVNIFTGLL